tara:strand:- start:2084 stop:3415 length:1332 start_codon:yes stop_codon:yes gene_type:complete
MLPRAAEHENLRGEKKADLAGAALSIFRSAAGLWSGRTNDETKVWFSKMDMDAMTDFQEVQNSQLGDALQKKSTFSRDEMYAFGIDMSFWWQERDKDIKYGIRVGEDVWQMHVGGLATDEAIAPPTAKRPRAIEQSHEEMVVHDSKTVPETLPETSPNRLIFEDDFAAEAGADVNDAKDIKEIHDEFQEIIEIVAEEKDEFGKYSPPAAAGVKKIETRPLETSYTDSPDSPPLGTSSPRSEPGQVDVKEEELPSSIQAEDNQNTIPPGINDKNDEPTTKEPPADTDARFKDIVTRAIHDGVAGALRDLNPEPSHTVEVPASEPTELVLGHDYDFLASIAQSARFGKHVTPTDVLCAGMAANLTVATARQMTFDYRRRFNAPAPPTEAMAMEDLSGYTREVLLAFRLLDVCLKPQWTRVGTQKRIELEFYSAVKDAVETTMSRR